MSSVLGELHNMTLCLILLLITNNLTTLSSRVHTHTHTITGK